MPDPIKKIELSRYAMRVLDAHPAWRAELAAPAPFARAEMDNALRGPFADGRALKKALRELGQRVLLRAMTRVLSSRAGRGAQGAAERTERLAEVCATMSDLAESALRATLDFIDCAELAVVGMGKLGGRELNVSSDIDLVFVHPGGVDEQERYEAAARQLIRPLGQVNVDRFVVRL